MTKIISTFDDLFVLYSRRHQVDTEIESVITDVKYDFDNADYAALNKLVELKREEISYFFEHGYLSDRDYNNGISALFKIEDMTIWKEKKE